MTKKVSIFFVAYNVLFLMIFLAASIGGKFKEAETIQYVTEEGSTEIDSCELTGDDEVTFQFKNSFEKVNNLIFKFSGCQNHESGVLSVRIYNDDKEYYVYEVPTYAFVQDIFYLYTNEVLDLENAGNFKVTVAVEGLEEGSLFLHVTEENYSDSKDGQMSPFWGIDGVIMQTSEELGTALLLWVLVDVIYIIIVLLFLRFYTDAVKEKLLNKLRSLEKVVYVRLCLLVILAVITGVMVYQYEDSVIEEKTYEYWSHNYVAEFINIPVKNGEILQKFTAGYDRMEQFILVFDNYSADDDANIYVSLEDARGQVYYSWSGYTANFSGEIFYLVGKLEKELDKGQDFFFRINLDSSESEITVRALSEEDIHKSAGSLTVDEEMIEETVLYFCQNYREYFSYARLWTWVLVVTFVIFLFITFTNREFFRKVWNIAGILLLVVVSYYNIESLSGNLNLIERQYAIVNCVIILGLYLLVKAVLPRGAYYLTTIVALVAGLANFYVLQFRGTELLVSDLKSVSTAISVVGNYEFTIPPVVYSSVLLSFCLMFVQCAVDAKYKSVYRKTKLYMRAVSMLLGVLAWVSVSMLITVSVKQEAFNFFTLSKNFSKYGWCYSNAFVLKLSSVQKPNNYSDKQIEKIISGIEQEVNSETESIIPQNLIVIMNESLSDLSVIGELQTNRDYMPFIRSLSENTVKGNLHVSTFGGNTCITEYEFLTGNSKYLLPVGSVPYSSVCEEYEEGMVRTLQAQGYYAVAMHPYGPSNWNRDTVYPAMGFDEFLSINDYEGSQLMRSYVSDKADYQKIIEYYENFDKDEKLFVFNVTMQNHGGYDINNGVLDTTVKIQNFDSSVGETYLSLVKESDDAFKDLLSYFSEVDEPTMIVMFGDHQPSLPDNFYENLYGKDMGDRNSQELRLQYITPYIVWTNYDSDFEEIPDISVNYLGRIVMQYAGLELSEYDKFLLQKREEVPVMGKYGIYDVNGNYIIYKEIPDELLNDYHNLQYMRIEDRKSKYYDIFSID